MLSRSKERNTFQSQKYRGIFDKDPTNTEAKAMIEMYDEWSRRDLVREADSEWAKHNLEYDLRSTNWILEKTRESRVYAQNLYAAMCNQDFTQNDVWPLLQDKRWSCSWRHAGGIIADMRQEGDYIEWYCSGIQEPDSMLPEVFNNLTAEQQTQYKEVQAYVAEGIVTDEIRADLLRLGWIPATQPDID